MRYVFLALALVVLSCQTAPRTESFVENETFENDWVYIKVVPGVYRLVFTLKNKSSKPLKLIWDECAVIDQDGTTHYVFGSGVKMIDVKKSKTPSIIYPGAKIDDIFVSTALVYESSPGAQLRLMDNRYYPIGRSNWFAPGIFEGPRRVYTKQQRIVFALERQGKTERVTLNVRHGAKRLKQQ